MGQDEIDRGELHLALKNTPEVNNAASSLKESIDRITAPYSFAIEQAAQEALDTGNFVVLPPEQATTKPEIKPLPKKKRIFDFGKKTEPAMPLQLEEAEQRPETYRTVNDIIVDRNYSRFPVTHTIDFYTTEEGIKLKSFIVEYKGKIRSSPSLELESKFDDENNMTTMTTKIPYPEGFLTSLLGQHTMLLNYYGYLNPTNQLNQRWIGTVWNTEYKFADPFTMRFSLNTVSPDYHKGEAVNNTLKFDEDQKSFLSYTMKGDIRQDYYLDVLAAALQLMPFTKSNQ